MTLKPCGTCTKCCEGWLEADIKGHRMYPGKPCHFVEIGKGCTIYKDRPRNPCQMFSCSWRLIQEMPEIYKPENSNVIMYWDNMGYWIIANAPDDPSEDFLSWAIDYAERKKQNITWKINKKSYWYGNKDFCKDMEKLYGVR